MSLSERKLKDLDQKFESFISRVSIEFADSEFTPEKAAERRAKANASDLDFAKIYYPQIFDDSFNAIHEWISERKQGNFTVSGSRFFGKSAFCYVGKGIKHIATGGGGIFNISLKTQTPAEERTASISRLIQRNKLLCYDYGIRVIQDLKGYHIFQADNGITTMIATSVNQGLRNYTDDDFKRFRLGIFDDLYNRESVKSQADNQRVFDFIVSEAWGQMEPDGLSFFLGNSITEGAPIVQVRNLNPDNHFSLPAMNTSETETNWPDSKWTVEALHEKRDSIPLDVWLGDWMDSPLTRGEIFDPEWIRFVNFNLIQIIAQITVIDPAHGESPLSCDKSAVTAGIDIERKVHVTDIYLRNESYTLLFDYLYNLIRVVGNHKAILFENDFAQWNYAAPWYQKWRDENKAVLPIVTFNSKELKTEHRGADKDSRIMNLVHPHQTGQILYNETLQNNPDFEKYKKKNYIRFGSHKNAKLDGLDALATAYIMIWAYAESGSFRSLKQKSYNPKKLKEWFR